MKNKLYIFNHKMALSINLSHGTRSAMMETNAMSHQTRRKVKLEFVTLFDQVRRRLYHESTQMVHYRT